MTGQEWRACADPGQMLVSAQDMVSARKLRLFEMACCRRVWVHLSQGCREAAEIVERFADGEIGPEGLGDALALASASVKMSDDAAVLIAALGTDEWYATNGVSIAAAGAGASHRFPVPGRNDADAARFAEERAEQAALLRDILGYPFLLPPPVKRSRVVSLLIGLVKSISNATPVAARLADGGRRSPCADLAWLSPTAVRLAGAIYQSRAFDRMPVLADALEEAGCDNPDVLSHCRGEGVHVRGCWVLDLVLGKQ